MKKGVLGVVVTVIALAGIVIIVALNQTEESNISESTTTTTNQPAEANVDSENADESASAVKSGKVAIDIKDYEYSEKTLRIKKGTTVTWTNRDTMRHDVKPDSPSDAFKPSELLAKDESYSFTFDVPGNYSYFCSPHPYMKASIEVVE